ncbi:hypothetical protein F5884DRAFT_677788 [Xylogone sp. PMI_703]|nr:hypothetical protein F5884DRAFT_677788 [Xylogone sp. PMI_703]
MEIAEVADQYFTYQDRLASFQIAHPLPKRTGSTVNSKVKPLKWPHKFLSGDALAKAGFFYHPLEANPDNVACFLCHKFLDGWEKGDDPLREHLTLSPDCGWAILATIESQEQDLSEHNPMAPGMVAARKATFANKWPYESKKGWKCKTKQMVDAGWMYTPMPESDDMATCVYCQLALDGWEPSDKPWDEHYARSPSCSFFLLSEENKQTKTSKNKKDRSSKASRLSTQSAFTTASEAPSLADLPVEEDSILTTVTTASTTGTKKMAKEKKASTRGRKTKAKKSEAVEIEQPQPDQAEVEVKANTKAKNGRKRKSEEAVDVDTSMVDAEVPPPKPKKVQQIDNVPAPEPEAVENSVISEVPPTKAPKARGRPAKVATHAPQPTTSAEGAPRSPSPSPREATPSQSPQSSDAENHPPSSRPSLAKSPLPPVSSTPQGTKTPTMSPSKRNVISGLQSTEPWTAVDLDTFLISPESKGNGLFDRQIENLKKGELASPEKKMTVEEWIYHNAQLAEEKLRNDCEKMVGDFEREGGRAMKALEGIICNE